MALQAHMPPVRFNLVACMHGRACIMVSLNDINKEADDRYGPLIIEDVPGGDVTLRNLIRCTENEMAQTTQLDARMKQAQKDNDIVGAVSAARDLLELVAVGDGGTRLLADLDGDSAKIMYVLELWAEATQAGEALRSDNSSEITVTP